jgi:hypothetical protein
MGKLCQFCNQLPLFELGFHFYGTSYFTRRVGGKIPSTWTYQALALEKSRSTCTLCSYIFANAPKETIQTLDKAVLKYSTYSFFLERPGVTPQINSGNLVMFIVEYLQSQKLTADGYYPSISFQKFDNASIASEIKLDESTGHWSRPTNEDLYIGRPRAQHVDFELLRKWMCACLVSHKHKLPFQTITKPGWIRFVDVRQKNVVELHNLDSVDWVALSYLWGAGQPLRLLKDSKQDVMAPGSLNDKIVPATIYDAIIVTEKLGQRFLWVDALCIVQDDDDDKVHFLPQMAAIYSYATFTIIDAAGSNSHDGLPGVSSSRAPQDILTLPEMTMVRFADPGPSLGLFTLGSWDSRGWTLQEGILSSRSLIFTPEKVLWQCNQWTWQEDSSWENNHSPFKGPNPPRFDLVGFNSLWSNSKSLLSVMRPYAKVVTEISARKLSYEADVLDAIAGIQHVITLNTGCEFFWGIPDGCIARWLIWERHQSVILTRREKMCRVAGTGESPFPSWSWAGWVGRVKDDRLAVWSVAPYFKLDRNGEALILPQAEDFLDFRAKPPPSHFETQISGSDIPQTVSGKGLIHSVLCFWAFTSPLLLPEDTPKVGTLKELNALMFEIANFDAKKIYVVWDCWPSGLPLKFVEVMRHDYYRRGVVVEDDGGGVLYRRGACYVQINDQELPLSTWEKVFLA